MACDQLTRRERQILELVAEGCTIDEAAHRLGIAHTTARNLAARARARLDARSTAQACCLMIRAQLARS